MAAVMGSVRIREMWATGATAGDKGQYLTYIGDAWPSWIESPPERNMNVKTTITLSEAYLEYAEKMVADGIYPSVSSVIEAGLERMMQDADPLAGMVAEIRRRMELPRDQWISMKEDDLFDRVRARIEQRSKG
jgi:antitoxin ParD1/3/4